MSHWSTQQTNIFLEKLQSSAKESRISDTTIKKLDGMYHFSESGNAEIKFRWQSLCLRCEALWIIPKVVEFLGSQGRMKFVRPLYRALAALDQGPSLAKETFLSLCGLYHPIARKMVSQDLGVIMRMT